MNTVAAPPAGAPAGSDKLGFLRSKTFQGSLTFIAFLAVFAGYGVWLGDLFLNTDARFLDIHQNAPILILGLAVLLTLIAGQFDLSVAGMATLTTYLSVGLVVDEGWPFGMILVACLACGLLGGLLNGFLVTKLGVNTFIATLGTGGIFVGLSNVLFGGSQLAPSAEGRQLPSWFSGDGSLGAYSEKFPSFLLWAAVAVAAVAMFFWLRRISADRPGRQPLLIPVVVTAVVVLFFLFVANIGSWIDATSWTIGVTLIIGAIIWTLDRFTSFGRYLRATGSNADAARLAGVKTERQTIVAFVLGGVLAATAGVVLAANQGSASPDIGTGFLLPAFAAAFLSTVILSTGQFNVWGTLIGGTFLVWVSQGLIVGGLDFTWTDVVNGVVLILAVALSTTFYARRT